MKNQIFETTSKMYQEEKEKYYHYSALNALYRAMVQGYQFDCHKAGEDTLYVRFCEGGHEILVYPTWSEFLKCVAEATLTLNEEQKKENEWSNQ